MADLVIKQSELVTLDKIMGDIPMKFGMPLFNFINGVVQLRQKEAQEAQQLALAKLKTTPTEAADPSKEADDGGDKSQED